MKSRYEQFEFAKGWASVSQVCGLPEKPFLYAWYGKLGWAEASRINGNSKKIGHLIDNEICHYFGDESTEEIDRSVLEEEESKGYYLTAINNFHKAVEAIKPKSVLSQYPVYSMTNKYIGTFDRLMVVDKKLVLADWKATNFVSYEYKMQLEAYYRALTEMMKAGIIKVDKEFANLEWHEYPLWLVQFPKKEEINLEKHIIKFKPKQLRFDNFLNLLNYIYGKKQDEVEDKPVKIKKEKKLK